MVRLRFLIWVQGGEAAVDCGDVVGGGFPDEWFRVVIPVFGPGRDGGSEVEQRAADALALYVAPGMRRVLRESWTVALWQPFSTVRSIAAPNCSTGG